MDDILKNKIKILPNNPGCYLYLDQNNKIIYIGKAKNIKKRVYSYFNDNVNVKTKKLVENIEDIQYIVVSSEKEALFLENKLIKKYKPYYNIKLKDDKRLPYIVITNEDNPRVIISKKFNYNSKNLYFGPYQNNNSANILKDIIYKLFPLRRCNPIAKRPCLYYQINECIGPCAKNISREEYNLNIKKIEKFLNGNKESVLKILNEKIKNNVKKLNFEEAQRNYELIKLINISLENQTIYLKTKEDRDYVGYYLNEHYICIQIFLYRFGSIIERKVEYFDVYDDYKELIYLYLVQYYTKNKKPKKIYIKGLNNKFLEDILKTEIISPKRGTNKKIIKNIEINSKKFLENNLIKIQEKHKKNKKIVEKVSNILNIGYAKSIDMFDNSNILGQNAVSAKVNYIDGEKNKNGYKKYRIQNNYIDDVFTLKNVLYKEYRKKEFNLPDLIIVDGGIQHVKGAIEVIHKKLKLNIKIIGLVKNKKHKTDHIITDEFEKIKIKKNLEEFLFLENIQEEVHRFAISYHRNIRNKSMYNSVFDNIKGIGIKRKKILYDNFSSIESILNTTDEKLVSIGIPLKITKELKKILSKKSF